MLAKQQTLWPKGAPQRPTCFNVSLDLGNSMHIDHDGGRCWAMWGRTGVGSQGWLFLFPMHGVAIRMRHLVSISWEGPEIHHCTCMPTIMPCDHFISIFAALPADVVRQFERRRALAAQIAVRRTPASGPGVRPNRILFNEGDRVQIKKAVREMPPHLSKTQRKKWSKKHWVVQNAKVMFVTTDGVHVKLLDEKGTDALLTHREAQARLVVMQ